MTTGNRTSEPTEAQVEAAAKAIEKIPHLVWDSPRRDDAMTLARAALVAAAGAAPQAAKDIHEPSHDRVYCVRCGGNWPCQAPQTVSAPKSSYISPSLPAMIRNLWKSDPSENSVRTALKLAGDLIQELIDLKASPVLPSSTVDEDALAEVKARALDEAANDLRVSFSRGAAIAMHHQCHKKQCRCGNPGNDEIVRAVFEAAREELRARAEAYRREGREQ